MDSQERPGDETTVNCVICGKRISKDDIANNSITAPQCKDCFSIDSLSDSSTSAMVKSEQHRQELTKQQELSGQDKVKQKTRTKLFIIAATFLILCIQLILLNLPHKYEPVDKTDIVGNTDYCLLNLVEIAKAFEQGKVPDKEYRCPLTDSLYIVSNENGIMTISNPNPHLHGYIEMSVSQGNAEITLIEDPDYIVREDEL